MEFPKSFFEDEVRDGFFVPAMMKRAWAAEMQILEDVDRVCRKHDIRYFVDWGTLLGAVRHGGFVPWDDDLDISMLRNDYNKFAEVAPKEMNGWYRVRSIKESTEDNEWEGFMISVIGVTDNSTDRDFLEYFQGYPFTAALDIFPLDKMAPNKKADEMQLMQLAVLTELAGAVDSCSEKDRNDYLRKVEEIYHVRLDKNKKLKPQFAKLLDKICSTYNETDSQYLTVMTYRTHAENRFPAVCFAETVERPFEGMNVPLPAGYEDILREEYGDWKKIVRGGSTHNYPVYGDREIAYERECGISLSGRYRFNKNDLKREKSNDEYSLKSITVRMLKLLDGAHKSIIREIAQKNFSAAVELSEQCQDGAIVLGTKIEKVKGEGYVTVKYLEQYCETLYELHEAVLEGVDTDIRNHLEKLHEIYDLIEKSAEKDILQRKEAVFLPFKASAWDSFTEIWEELKHDPAYDIYVVPIPYYYRELDGKLGEVCFNIKDYPENIKIEDYQTFDFELHHPDMILIHNPYDSHNITIGVHPFFYSDNLVKFTDNLVYTPYFRLCEFDSDDTCSVYNMQHYCLMPGVVHADTVIVQSENMRRLYIDRLTEFAGEETRHVWEKKIWAKLPPCIKQKK